MAVFRFVVSRAGRSWQIEKEQNVCPVLGKKAGETIDGGFLGLEGYLLKITGGTNKDGIPQNPDLESAGKRRLLLGKGFGFSGKKKLPGKPKKRQYKHRGMRVRRMSRGGIIAADTMQINCVVEKEGAKKIEEIFPAKEKTENEAKKESPKEDKPEEKKA